jgi:hypothetical protein
MPTIRDRHLTLTASRPELIDNVAVNVSYKAVFTPLERYLAANGLVFEERIVVLGMDLNVATALFSFPRENIPVSLGTTPLTVTRNRTMSVTRANLIEDKPRLNPDGSLTYETDEICCRIEINPIGLPTSIDGLTNQVWLAPPPSH